MPRTATRFVAALSDEERDRLRSLKDFDPARRIRQRAQAILLSDAGKTVNEIADIFDVDRDTVCSWLKRWETEGSVGLEDQPRSGAPPILDESEQQRALEILLEHPHSPKLVLRQIEKEIGKTISRDTLRRLARKSNLTWKRMRKSLKSQRDEEEFRESQEELVDLIASHQAGELDLYYFDESGFCLTPEVPYGWQPIGETTEIPSKRSQRLNILGFLKYNETCLPYAVEGKVTSRVVVDCFDDFCKTLKRDSVVVLDNASIHSSQEFLSHIPRWQEQGLELYWLPAYCPELNLIEILWRMIKYHWIPLKAYDSYQSLVSNLFDIFRGIGKKYILQFGRENRVQN